MKDSITVNFIVVNNIYNQHIPHAIKNRLHKDSAIFLDNEIITISIVGEFLPIDLEMLWLSYIKKILKDLFPKMCNRSRFNRTQRNLLSAI